MFKNTQAQRKNTSSSYNKSISLSNGANNHLSELLLSKTPGHFDSLVIYIKNFNGNESKTHLTVLCPTHYTYRLFIHWLKIHIKEKKGKHYHFAIQHNPKKNAFFLSLQTF